MAATVADVRTIVVAGDVTVDWLLARVRRPAADFTAYQYIWTSDVCTRACSQMGGAALIASILGELAGPGATGVQHARVVAPTLPPEALLAPSCAAVTRSYSVWAPFPRAAGEKKSVWRATDFWGADRVEAGATAIDDPGADAPWGLVIDDASLGFREQAAAWPRVLTHPSAQPACVVVKLAHPVGQGALWDRLIEQFRDRLVVVVPVSELRKASLTIGYGLSWEQTGEEISRAVRGHAALSSAAAVVVPIGATGGVVVHRDSGAHLVFDPQAQEDDWLRLRPGQCIGYATCAVAAVVRHLLVGGDRGDLVDALRRGTSAARALHVAGYGDADTAAALPIRFPVSAVVDAMSSPSAPFATVALDRLTAGWTILDARGVGEAHDVSAAIVRRGAETVLRDVPLERVGHWASVDRVEIESVRTVRNVLTEYAAQKRPARPLSLAVFGPPGAGKSFAVKEVARALVAGRLQAIEFNLSQFESPDELAPAFHRVRDAALRGELPLVFWDEFDTPLGGRPLGWLRYFLAPMQDGEFREAGVLHPIGPAIFVFAGGVFPTLDAFRAGAEADAASKGRDFVSRLRGFLNVLGPNARDGSDRCHVLRRGLLLRSLLLRKAGHLVGSDGALRIDDGVLQAFLRIPHYRHGARSMECLIDMSALSGKLLFERSALPPPDQLDLHVDGGQFLRLVAGGVANV